MSTPNLVVMQTFSKAWGLAALRLGMAFAHPNVVAVLDRIKPPYNVSGASQELALQALQRLRDKEDLVRVIIQERDRMEEVLHTIAGVQEVYPSQTNFILVKVPQAAQIYDDLVNRGVIVRDRSRVIRCDDCLRITVGTKEENNYLLKYLKQILA